MNDHLIQIEGDARPSDQPFGGFGTDSPTARPASPCALRAPPSQPRTYAAIAGLLDMALALQYSNGFVHGSGQAMHLLLINPSNPLVSIVNLGESRWNHYRVWQPLSLMALAGLTPREWEVTIVDENLGVPDYSAMPRPDLVGITAFTSQAGRAYIVAGHFRRQGVPVVMGGIHATMCLEEVSERVDSVVAGEAEGIWAQVLEDVRQGRLQRRYDGGLARIDQMLPARHDLLQPRYAFGAIQTTRGCPLNCSFCSVTSFNGATYRQRPVEDVIREFQLVPEKRVLIVDDNLIGTRR